MISTSIALRKHNKIETSTFKFHFFRQNSIVTKENSPMQIVLNTHCDSETPPPEYFIIELQGTLEYTSSYHKQEYGAKKQQRIVSLNGLKIGEFDLDLNVKKHH